MTNEQGRKKRESRLRRSARLMEQIVRAALELHKLEQQDRRERRPAKTKE